MTSFRYRQVEKTQYYKHCIINAMLFAVVLCCGCLKLRAASTFAFYLAAYFDQSKQMISLINTSKYSWISLFLYIVFT